MSAKNGFIADLEWAAKETARWALDTRNYLLDAMAPDGRGWGQEDLTPRERLEDYLGTPERPGLKNNPPAITEWVIQRATKISEVVGTMGPAAIASVHPLDLAWRAWFAYSYQMEQSFQRELGKAQEGVAA